MTDRQAAHIFERLEAAYDRMAAFLESEREHLLAPDWAALTRDQQQRQELTEAIAAADAERRELARQLNLAGDTPFRDLLPGSAEWEERRLALRQRVASVQEVNRENTRLLKAAMERNERLIALLTGEGEVGYDAGGEAASGGDLGLMSRKA